VGYAPRTVVTFQPAAGYDPLVLKSFFQQEAIKRGILFTGGHNVSFAHRDADIEQTLAVYAEVMVILARAIETRRVDGLLEGPPVQPVFRKA
jgi:glutamate-1-semialdehyde aminotransferase